MNNNDPTENSNQADDLKQLFNEVNANQSNHLQEQSNNERLKIDVLNLPPRNEVHKNNKKRVHMTMSKPFLRLIFVVLLLIILIIISISVGGIDLFNMFK